MNADELLGLAELVPVADLTGYLDSVGLELGPDGGFKPSFVFVDLNGSIADPDALARQLAANPVVAVGIARSSLSPSGRAVARELACVLVPRGEESTPAEIGLPNLAVAAADLAVAIRRSPRAAFSLIRLLRVTSEVAVPDGLAAESAVYSMLLGSREFASWLVGQSRQPVTEGDGPPVIVERAGDMLDIVLNRPGKHNAFDRFVRDRLMEAFDVAIADPSILRVILRGNGPSFCSGGDLNEFGTSQDVSSAHVVRLSRSVAARLEWCRERVTARVHGACIGAGVEIPSFAARVLAREDAFFRLPELAMGLVPGAGGTVGITRRIGRWRTAYLALSGAPLDVSTALHWGLIDGIVAT